MKICLCWVYVSVMAKEANYIVSPCWANSSTYIYLTCVHCNQQFENSKDVVARVLSHGRRLSG